MNKKIDIVFSSKGFGTIPEDKMDIVKKDKIFTSGSANIEDFYFVETRAVSSGLVGKGTWKSTVFSEDVLKKTIKSLNNAPILLEHYESISNIVGKVFYTYFEEGVNSGVNVIYGINKKLDGLNIGNLIMNIATGVVKYHSIGISGKYDKSHPSMQDWDFRDRLGTVVDGKEVSRVVTAMSYRELSIVFSPADKKAEVIGKRNYNFSYSDEENVGEYDEELVSLSLNKEFGEHKPQTKRMKDLFLYLGLSEDATEQVVIDTIKANYISADTVSSDYIALSEHTKATDEITQLKQSLTDKEQELSDLTLSATATKDELAANKAAILAEVVRLQAVVNGSAVTEAEIANFNSKDATELVTLQATLATEAAVKFAKTNEKMGDNQSLSDFSLSTMEFREKYS